MIYYAPPCIWHAHVVFVMFVFFPFHPYVLGGEIILSQLKSALLFFHLFFAICILNHTVRFLSSNFYYLLTKLLKTNSYENIYFFFHFTIISDLSVKIHDVNKVQKHFYLCKAKEIYHIIQGI